MRKAIGVILILALLSGLSPAVYAAPSEQPVDTGYAEITVETDPEETPDPAAIVPAYAGIMPLAAPEYMVTIPEKFTKLGLGENELPVTVSGMDGNVKVVSITVEGTQVEKPQSGENIFVLTNPNARRPFSNSLSYTVLDFKGKSLPQDQSALGMIVAYFDRDDTQTITIAIDPKDTANLQPGGVYEGHITFGITAE